MPATIDSDISNPNESGPLPGFFPYETIKFSGRLRIIDLASRKARFVRRQRIRFLEDGVTVFMDRIWGDGLLFAGYFAPGFGIMEPIRAQKGFVIPLMLPRRFRKGETFDIVTERNVIGAFYQPLGHWDMITPAPTDLLTLTVESSQRLPLERPEIIAPSGGDIDAERSSSSLRFRVAKPSLDARYRLAWSWK
jgi:hypothetical protein